MKFLVPNYSCRQNHLLGGYRPQIPFLSVLCPQLNLLNTPLRTKFPGTSLPLAVVQQQGVSKVLEFLTSKSENIFCEHMSRNEWFFNIFASLLPAVNTLTITFDLKMTKYS